jgi:hypothetical protein
VKVTQGFRYAALSICLLLPLRINYSLSNLSPNIVGLCSLFRAVRDQVSRWHKKKSKIMILYCDSFSILAGCGTTKDPELTLVQYMLACVRESYFH